MWCSGTGDSHIHVHCKQERATNFTDKIHFIRVLMLEFWEKIIFERESDFLKKCLQAHGGGEGARLPCSYATEKIPVYIPFYCFSGIIPKGSFAAPSHVIVHKIKD